MIENNFIAFDYKCRLLGLTRQNKRKTELANQNLQKEVHKVNTDLSADDPIYKAIRCKRQDFINYLSENVLDWHGSIKLVSLDVTYFESFKRVVETFESEFYGLVEQFLPDEATYMAMIQRAKDNDPIGFEREKYPIFEVAKERFSFTYNFSALSNMSDARLDAINEHNDFIKKKAKEDHIRNLERVEKQTQDRIADSVRHIIRSFSSQTITDKDGNQIVKPNRFQESSMLKHLELVKILNAFNIGNNSVINDMISDFEKAISPIARDQKNDFETLRDNDDTRLKIKSDMEAIISKFKI